MKTVVDQLGRTVICPDAPQRIISLVPSQTELLHYLDLAQRVVGITKFCIHPADWFRSKERVGGTKTPDLEKVRSLRPDLIIANKEENDKASIMALAEEFPLWISDVQDLTGAIRMIQDVGALTGSVELAAKLEKDIHLASAGLLSPESRPTALYLIWDEPITTVGTGTFIDSMLQLAGFSNVLAQDRYPIFSLEEVQELRPDFILYSSEPFPFKESHTQRFRAILPDATHILVDGEAFSWYGSRIPDSLNYLGKLRSKPT